MTAIQLRTELFREMSPLLDSEVAMRKVLAFVKSLSPAKKAKAEQTAIKSYKVMPVSPNIKRWSGSVSFSEDEIESDPRLKAIISR